MPQELRSLLLENYGLNCAGEASIFNGDEARVWRVASDGGDFVVHLGPHWRSSDELAWVHKVVRFAAVEVLEAVVPIETLAGETFVENNGALVALYPFVEGRTLDRDDEDEVREAGRLLSNIHRRLLKFDGGKRPMPSYAAP